MFLARDMHINSSFEPISDFLIQLGELLRYTLSNLRQHFPFHDVPRCSRFLIELQKREDDSQQEHITTFSFLQKGAFLCFR